MLKFFSEDRDSLLTIQIRNASPHVVLLNSCHAPQALSKWHFFKDSHGPLTRNAERRTRYAAVSYARIRFLVHQTRWLTLPLRNHPASAEVMSITKKEVGCGVEDALLERRLRFPFERLQRHQKRGENLTSLMADLSSHVTKVRQGFGDDNESPKRKSRSETSS